LRQCEILHNDIKPHNVLLFKLDLGRAFQWQTKLSDFGSSNSAHDPRRWLVCTPDYAAPELLRTVALDVTGHGTIYPYTYASDAWSIRITLAELLSEDASRCAVAAAENPKTTLYEGYLSSLQGFVAELGSSMHNASCMDAMSGTHSGIALVSELVQMDASARTPVAAALQHPWFTEAGTAAPLTVHGKDQCTMWLLSSLSLALARAFCLLVGIRGYHGVKWLGPQIRKSMDILRGQAAGFKEWGICLAEAFVKESMNQPEGWAAHQAGWHRFYSGGPTSTSTITDYLPTTYFLLLHTTYNLLPTTY
jgi:hypothetical protein